ncbi:MAG: hypothetical protein ACOX1P_15340 [Thermoguttaceae bacterium]|jgi:hypothetical protein
MMDSFHASLVLATCCIGARSAPVDSYILIGLPGGAVPRAMTIA